MSDPRSTAFDPVRDAGVAGWPVEPALAAGSAEAPAGSTEEAREPDGNGRPDNRQQARSGASEPSDTDGAPSAIMARWSGIQGGFVDEPQAAVRDADALIADLTRMITDGFATERQQLAGRWNEQGQVSTEELRLAMQRYRTFLDRLLSVEGLIGRPM
jgi:hypothetical protein